MTRRRRAHVLAIGVAGALWAAAPPGTALAYPQFQLSTDAARCSLCHFSPVGGGLINAYGRDEAADTISRAESSNGDFLYGAWEPPDWLFLGADLRFVGAYKDTGAADPETLLFPMQGDLYSLVKLGPVSVSLTGGLRGAARPRDPPPTSRIGSREHYVMWRPKTTGPYARIGRFHAPFGLRLVDHTAYIRRYLGSYAWEETYGLSGGYVKNQWELHATAFMADPITKIGPEATGGAVLYERRMRDDTAAWGGQARIAVGAESTRSFAGAVGKLYLNGTKLLVLAEVDGGIETFAAAGASARPQLALHLNATYFATRGVMTGVTLEHYDEDVSLAGTQRDSASVILQYFPLAHWELFYTGKLEHASGQPLSVLGMLMVHYYL
jgi:hypothetical protein